MVISAELHKWSMATGGDGVILTHRESGQRLAFTEDFIRQAVNPVGFILCRMHELGAANTRRQSGGEE